MSCNGFNDNLRWGFVIHGGVDGYSRLPVFLVCATDNCAQTVLKAFSTAVAQYGWPVRVRADCGGENVDVANLMESNFGNGIYAQFLTLKQLLATYAIIGFLSE